MKKIIVITCLVLQICIPVFGEYVPIPEILGKQYKTEMEQIIDEEYPKAVKNVDKLVLQAKGIRNNLLKSGYSPECYMQLVLISEADLPAADVDMFVRLTKVTMEEYLEKSYKTTGADDSYYLESFLFPYYKAYSIDTKKLVKLEKYIDKKINVVEKYVEDVKNFYYIK